MDVWSGRIWSYKGLLSQFYPAQDCFWIKQRLSRLGVKLWVLLADTKVR